MNIETKKNQQTKWIKLTIILFCFLIYGNSIKNEYALDDNYVTTTDDKNPHPRVQKGIKGIPEIFKSHYVESNQQNFEYRPIVLTTFAIEYQFFGRNPHISHFINVALYTVTCLLLFVVLSILLSNYNSIFPILITLLFIAHPIHTEVVNNLKSRDELLSFLFGLCSLFYFIKKTEGGTWKSIFLGLFFLLLAVLSKRTAVLFFALIPLTLYFFTTIKVKKLIGYIIILPTLVFLGFKGLKFFFLEQAINSREFAFFENPLFYEPSLLKRIPMAFYTAGYYFKLLVFPHPLSCYYGFKTIPLVDWTFVSVWISLIFHVAIGIYALLKLYKKSIISYAIIIYFVGIFPFSNFYTPVVGIVGERFIYFASLGFCIALAHFLVLTFKIEYKNSSTKWKGLNLSFKTTFIIILCLYSIKTISRNTAWKDHITLFKNDVEHFENSCNLNYILANHLTAEIAVTPVGIKRNSLIKEATFYFKKTTELMREGIEKYPEDYITTNNLARLLVDVFNDAVVAQPLFKKVITINPDNLEGQFNFGYCYEKRNLPDSAIYWYEKILSTNIKYPKIYSRLHELYYQKHDYFKAIVSDRKALNFDPQNIAFHINLGNSYMLNGDTLAGLNYFEKAAAIPPLDYVLLQNISNVFKVTGDTLKARYYEKLAKNTMK